MNRQHHRLVDAIALHRELDTGDRTSDIQPAPVVGHGSDGEAVLQSKIAQRLIGRIVSGNAPARCGHIGRNQRLRGRA